LVGFGSVIDLGIHTEASLQDAKKALENVQNTGLEGGENAKKVEEAKKLVQTIEDNIAKEKALLEVFGQFQGKQREFPLAQFILKYGPKEEKKYKKLGNYENVYGIGWMAQKPILSQGQDKVRAFVSHCGINSVNEAFQMGVPLICVPVFGDQLNNAEALASRGVAEVIGNSSND
jgi:UDP-N-acetylglucosamine:LPS N-acetylglucosamine transferase